MKARPIIFAAESVRAILAGTKTQTRRLVRVDDTPIVYADGDPPRLQRGIPTNARNVRYMGPYLKCDAPCGSNTVSSRVPCPYGSIVGPDRLWVKEAWQYGNGLALRAAGDGIVATGEPAPRVLYRADGVELPRGCAWRSPLFMPRALSRLTLEVTGVRVERLQSITPADAVAEGVTNILHDEKHRLHARTYAERGTWTGKPELDIDGPYAGAVDAYATLWDAINGKKPGARWSDSPWVWAITFRCVVESGKAGA